MTREEIADVTAGSLENWVYPVSGPGRAERAGERTIPAPVCRNVRRYRTGTYRHGPDVASPTSKARDAAEDRQCKAAVTVTHHGIALPQ